MLKSKIVMTLLCLSFAYRLEAKPHSNELRTGVGLPFTFIASTPGVIQLNVNLEYSRRMNNTLPFFKVQYSRYQRMSRKKGVLIATEFDRSLSGIEFHTGLKFRSKYKDFELRPLLAVGRGFGRLHLESARGTSSNNYSIYTIGLELFSMFEGPLFLSFAGTISKIVHDHEVDNTNIKYNRPTLELNVGKTF